MVVQFRAWPARPLPLDGAAAAPARLGDGFRTELRPLSRGHGLVDAWRDLAARSLEPNVFYEPDAMLAAAQHLPEAGAIELLTVRDDRPGAHGGRLLALWPVHRAKRPWDLARGFGGRYVTYGAPLLDRQLGLEAASALIEHCRSTPTPLAGLMFRALALDGPAARSIAMAARLAGHSCLETGAHWRAAFTAHERDPEHATEKGRLRREIGRLRRGLAGLGPLRLASARTPEAVRDALEFFLALEASGWKARRGTALLHDPRSSVYFRTLVRTLARQGQATVHLLEAGDRVIAAGLVLGSGGHGWYVKTAYDEDLAAHAPGAVLSHAIAEQARTDHAIAQLDSCAVPGHAMIERVWSGRLRVGDLVVGFGSAAETCLRRDARRAQWRLAAKRLYYRVKGLGPTGVPLRESEGRGAA
jgi:CelD/BcsL family acetyltransferase involved in cellulose biosynthesis